MLKDLKRYEVFFKENKSMKNKLIRYGMDFTQPFSISKITEPTTLKTLLKKEYSEDNYKYILKVYGASCKYVNITGAKFVKDVDVKQFYRGTYKNSAEQIYTKIDLDRSLSNNVSGMYILETTKPLKEVGVIPEYKSIGAILKRSNLNDTFTIKSRVDRFARDNYKNIRCTNIRQYMQYHMLDKSGYMIDIYREKLHDRLIEYKQSKINKLGLEYEPYLSLLDSFNTLQDTIKENLYNESNTSEMIQSSDYIIAQIYNYVVRIKRVLLGDLKLCNFTSIEQLNSKIREYKEKIDEVVRKLRG